MDKVDHPVFFLTMKRLFIALFVIAGMAAVLGVSTSAAGSITATLNEPLIDYTYTDDPDDPFESFVAYSSYAGRSEQFWTSEDPDLLMIPDMYLVSGMHFYIEGSTALGNTVRSNIVTYFEPVFIPDLSMSTVQGWDIIEVDPFDYPSKVSSVYLCAYKGNTFLGRQLVEDRSGVFSRRFDVFSLLYGFGAFSIVSDYDYITFNLKVYDSSDNLLSTGRNYNYQFVNSYIHMPMVVYNDFEVESAYFSSAYGLAYWNSRAAVSNVKIEVYAIDDDSLIGTWDATPVKVGARINRDLLTQLINAEVITGSGEDSWFYLQRSIKLRFKFLIGDRVADQLTFYSDYLVKSGLDGLGDLAIPSDPTLFKPSDTEIVDNVTLIYRGVKNTSVYRYIFSALAICLPFAGAIFVINKVH